MSPAGCDRQERQKRICGEKLWGRGRKGAREIGGVEKRGLHGEYFNTKTYQLAWARTDTHTHIHASAEPFFLQRA